MPAKNDENSNFVSVIEHILDIFDADYIHFTYSDSDITVVFDRDQLGRVITNLIKDVIQVTENVPMSHIEVSLYKDNDCIASKVKDNGIDIEETDRDKIFELCFTTKTSGSGLGLAMVENIILSYGGTISFTSEVGKGSEFIVVLAYFLETNQT